jgi:hypothetical protein
LGIRLSVLDRDRSRERHGEALVQRRVGEQRFGITLNGTGYVLYLRADPFSTTAGAGPG